MRLIGQTLRRIPRYIWGEFRLRSLHEERERKGTCVDAGKISRNWRRGCMVSEESFSYRITSLKRGEGERTPSFY